MTKPFSVGRVHAPRARYWPLLAVVTGSTFISMFTYSAPLGNAVTLAASLNASSVGTIWILASMSSGLAAALLAAGLLADRIGHRRVFRSGAAMFAVAHAVCALSPDVWMFIGGRVIAGVGAAGLVATGLGLVDAAADSDHQRRYTARAWSVAMGVGIAAGPVGAGLLDVVDQWRALYLTVALSGTLIWALASARRVGSRSKNTDYQRQSDWLGVALLVGALGSLLAGIVEIRAGSAVAVALLGLTASALFLMFWASQHYRRRGLIDSSLFLQRRFLAATLAGLAAGLGVISVMSAACTYFVTVVGMTTLQAGAALACWSVTGAIAAVALGVLAPNLPSRTALVSGLSGAAGGMLLLLGIGRHGSPRQLFIALMATGVATGILNYGLARESVAAVAPIHAATSTATNNTARYLGSSVGVCAAGIAITSPVPERGWNVAVAAAAGITLVIAIAFLRLTSRPSRVTAAAEMKFF